MLFKIEIFHLLKDFKKAHQASILPYLLNELIDASSPQYQHQHYFI